MTQYFHKIPVSNFYEDIEILEMHGGLRLKRRFTKHSFPKNYDFLPPEYVHVRE